LHVYGTGTSEGSVLFEGEYEGINAGPAPAEGSGTRMMWYPGKAAFRAGRVLGGQSSNWDTDSIGLNSTAFGWATKAKGASSMAWGSNAYAIESSATAWGETTKALGWRSTAWGQTTEATGQNSTTWGKNTKAFGLSSTAWGEATEAHSQNSTAWGTGTKAFGWYSTAAGGFTTAHSAYEMVFGHYNTEYTPGSAWSWVPGDRLFVIGNGTSSVNRSDAIVVLKSGNTGIGTSTPGESLEVDGNIHVSGGNRTIFNRSNNSLAFGTNNIERMRITNLGNMGVGTTSPNESLEVDGNIHVSGGNRTIFNRSSNSLAFGTSNTERMLITSGGNVGVGTNSPGALLHVERTSSSSTPQFRIHNSSATGFARFRLTNEAHEHYWDIASGGTNNYLDFYHNGNGGSMMTLRPDLRFVGIRTINPTFTLHVNGDAGKPGGGTWSSASDARLKSDVQDLQGSLENLLKLRGVTFLYNDPEAIHELPGERIGMIAQEVAEVFPDWVSEAGDGYLRLTYRGFEALMVEALRELRAEKDAEIESLNSRLTALEAMMDLPAANTSVSLD
jgi:hypothetical protein